MPHIIANRVVETSLTAGTGDFVLVTKPGYRRFADRMAPSDRCWYVAEQFSGDVAVAWEIGRAVYLGANTLRRVAVFESTNGNAPVSFNDSKKVITMAAVAPNGLTALEWQAAIGLTPSVPGATQDDLDELTYLSLEAIARAAALEFAALAADLPTEAAADADEASYQELEALAISATAQFNAEAKALTEALAT
jgi:hypothetical protein